MEFSQRTWDYYVLKSALSVHQAFLWKLIFVLYYGQKLLEVILLKDKKTHKKQTNKKQTLAPPSKIISDMKLFASLLIMAAVKWRIHLLLKQILSFKSSPHF